MEYVSFDRFQVESGIYPLILTGTHAFSIKEDSAKAIVNAKMEREYHLCDFAVHPILEFLRKEKLFYVIENMVPRYEIDMNRHIARKNNENDWDDYLYRQMIRYLLQYVRIEYKTLPFLIDLHSYPDSSDYGPYDMMLLIQTKSKMQTNNSLIYFTEKFFSERGWKISSTKNHNQDDIVEEIALKQMAIPILIEINENLLRSKKYPQFLNDFKEYCLEIVKRITKNIQMTFKFLDSGSINIDNSLLRDQVHLAMLSNGFANSSLATSYNKYLSLMAIYLNEIKKNPSDSAILKPSDSAITEIADFVQEDNPNGSSDFLNLDLSIIFGLSSDLDSCVIPLELVDIMVRIMYAEINKTHFEEWRIESLGLIRNLENLNIFPIRTTKIIESLFCGFKLDEGYFIQYLFIPDQISKISEKGQEKDIILLKKIIKAKPTENIRLSDKTFQKKLVKTIF